MDATFLINNLETLAEAPGGMAALRQTILDLAISGALVEQDLEDEPAWSIMGDESADTGLPGDASSTLDQNRPGWMRTNLGAIGSWGAGSTPRRSELRYFGGSINWFKSGELRDSWFLDGPSAETISNDALRECSLRENKPGDVLIAMYGATIGRVAILGCHGTTNQAVCGCTCVVGINNRFLFVFLRAIRPRLIESGAGGAQPNISKERIVRFPIDLPPTREQGRIVAKVDELMGMCDELEAKQHRRSRVRAKARQSSLNALVEATEPDELRSAWQRINTNWSSLTSHPDSIPDLRQTILELAIQGKLAPQDPIDNPASSLLTTAHEPPPICPYSVPTGWVWTRFEHIAESRLGKMLDQAKNTGALRAYLRNANVQWFRFDTSDLQELRIQEREYDSFAIRAGDVIICEGGEPGRCAVADVSVEGLIVQKALHRARPIAGVDPWYLAYVLRAEANPDGRLTPLFTGATIKHLTGRSLATFLVPLPPEAEQRRITRQIEHLFDLCNSLETAAKCAATAASGTLASSTRYPVKRTFSVQTESKSNASARPHPQHGRREASPRSALPLAFVGPVSGC